MKTYKQWQESNLDLDKFLFSGDRIDQKIFNYLDEITSPKYIGNNLVQTGEPSYKKNGVLFYMSAIYSNHKHYYLGILPEFKQ